MIWGKCSTAKKKFLDTIEADCVERHCHWKLVALDLFFINTEDFSVH